MKITSLVFLGVAALLSGCNDGTPPGTTPGCISNLNCNDGNPCTTDACARGACSHTPTSADDGVACTVDACNPTTGNLTHTPDDGACGDDDGVTCTVPVCHATLGCTEEPDDAQCPDEACVNTGVCDPQGGDALSGCLAIPLSIDDGVACTDDACDPATGDITHTPNNGACTDQDGASCSVPTCDALLDCVETPDHSQCPVANPCVARGVCDPSAGGAATGCSIELVDTDDGVPCTIDACDPADGTISHTPDDSACSNQDGASCTAPVCDAQQGCGEVANDAACDDGQPCSSDTCDPANGGAASGCAYVLSHTLCDDGVACTTDTCAALAGCTSVANDNACAQADYCDASNDCQPRRIFLASTIITEIMLGAGELVEIHNPTAGDGDIYSFALATTTGSAMVRAVSDPTGANATPVNVPAGGYVYGVPNPANAADIPSDAAFVYGEPGTAFALNASGDTLAFNSPTAGTLDDVDFTNFHTDPNTAIASGSFPGRAGASTQLDPAFLDTGDNNDGSNWCVTFRAAHSAGMANGSCRAVVINEIYYNFDHPTISAADESQVFIELAGPGGGNLAGLAVVGIDGNTGLVQTPNVVLGAVRMPVDGFFVVADGNVNGGTTQVPNADLVLGAGDPQNGPDAVRLTDSVAGGNVLDLVGYGAPQVNAEGTAVTDIPPDRVGLSIARDAASTDTNNNAADFHQDPTPTPGMANDAVVPTILSVTPDHGLATTTTTVVFMAVDFADFFSNVSANDVTATFAGQTTPDTTATNDGCLINDITDFGRGIATITCTAPTHSGVAVRGDLTLTNPAAVGGADTLTNGWTYTGALNETDVAAEADFCNLQFPASFSVQTGQATPLIFGRIFEEGVTQPAGAHPAVVAEVGYGATGSNPTTTAGWSFFSSAFNTQVGNDDEYQGSFTAPAVGAYAYAYRFSQDDGITFTYCDLDGAGSNAGLAFDPTTQLGVMTVTP